MDAFDFQPLITWLENRPNWIYGAIFVVACAESLAFVGLLVPGVVFLFMLGALIGAGFASLDIALLCAAVGAIVGDGLSYWLGRHYQEQLKQIWPFRNHPDWVEKGERFFTRHGGKSVLFGRFVGPIRPIIPAVAGMMGMSSSRFFVINVLSALAWSPVYLLPGVVFGLSFGLASEVAARLIGLIVGLIVAIWLLVWGIRSMHRELSPHATTAADKALRWSLRHPLLGRFMRTLVDPHEPESKGLFVLSLTMIIVMALFVTTLQMPQAVDDYLAHIARQLMFPWGAQLHQLFLLFSQEITLITIAALIAWRLFKAAQPLALYHWLAALVYALFAPMLFALVIPLFQSDESFIHLPSLHMTTTTMIYGFMAIMLAPLIEERQRWICYAVAATLVSLSAWARVFFNFDSFLACVNAIALALPWLIFLGVAYRQHQKAHSPIKPLVRFTFVTLVTACLCQFIYTTQVTPQPPTLVVHKSQTLDTQAWLNTGWQETALYRNGLAQNREPFTIQYSGDLNELKIQLQAKQWQTATPLSIQSMMYWFVSAPDLADLPQFPLIHDAQHEALTMIRPVPDSDRLYVLRLWPSQYILSEGQQRLWHGLIDEARRHQPIDWLTFIQRQPLNVSFSDHFPELTNTFSRQIKRHPDTHNDILLITSSP